jgi:hypothetical protein
MKSILDLNHTSIYFKDGYGKKYIRQRSLILEGNNWFGYIEISLDNHN